MKARGFERDFGARVESFDLRQLDASSARRLLELLERHRVLLFEGQQLEREDMLRVASHLGPPFLPPDRSNPVLAHGEAVVEISAREGGVLGSGHLPPHSDHAFVEHPSSLSLLYALEVAPQGGETTWYDLIGAYEALDRPTRARLAKLRVWNANPWAGPGAYKHVGGKAQPYAPEPPPRVFHPVVRVHSDGRRGALYVSALSRGLVDAEGQEVESALLVDMRRRACSAQLAWTHTWRPGDLVIFDNRVTSHARMPFSPATERRLWRVQIAGGRPRALEGEPLTG